MFIKNPKFICSSLILLIVSSQSVNANSANVEVIEIRSTRHAQPIQKVPIKIDSVSGELLSQNGVDDISQVTELLANVELVTSSQVQSQYSIRGVGTANFQSNSVSAVGLYMDDVQIPTPFSAGLSLFDMQQVEVLRGPQVILFGRNTTGGAVNFISNKPQLGQSQVSGYAQGQVGAFERRDIEAAVNLPIAEDWAARFAFQSKTRGDVFTNLAPGNDDVGEIDKQSARLQLAWEGSAGTRLLINLHSHRDRSEAGYGKANGLVDPNGGNCLDNGLVSLSQLSNFEAANGCVIQMSSGLGEGDAVNPSSDNWRELYSVSSRTGDLDIVGGFIKLEQSFQDLEFTSITAYDSTELYYREDEGLAPFDTFHPIQDASFDSYSQELRAQYDGDKLRWLGGYYYFYEESEQMIAVAVSLKSGDVDPLFTAVNAVILEQENAVHSLYGKLDYSINNRWSVDLGLRWTKESKDGDRTGISTGPGAGRGEFGHNYRIAEMRAFDKVIAETSGELTNEQWGYHASIKYQISDDAMLYSSVSKGFKAGSFDIRAQGIRTWGTPQEQEVEPESLQAFELGYKSSWLDDALTFNAAYFNYDFENLQLFTVIDGIPGLFNVPQSAIEGVDFDLNYRMANNWQISASLGLLETEITDNGQLVAFKQGSDLAQAPEISGNLRVVKETELKSGILRLQAAYRYVDDRLSQLPDNGVSRIGSENWLDVRASYLFGAKQQYQLDLFVDNVTGVKTCYRQQTLIGPSGAGAGLGGPTWAVKCRPNEGQALWGVLGKIRF